jgi:hypothetical protein
MSDFVIINNDTALFDPAFGPAVVAVQPGTIKGTATCRIAGQAVCLEGDESSVVVAGCTYISGSFCIPGTGTLKIAGLSTDQVAVKTTSDGKAVILKGSIFNAKFEVASPAQMPSSGPPVPDPVPQYAGTGRFTTTNTNVKAT